MIIENYGIITGATDYAILLIGTFDDQVYIDAVMLGSAAINGDVELGGGNDLISITGGTNLTLGGTLFGGTGNDVVTFDVPTGETLTYSFALEFSSTASSFENLVKQGTGTLALSSFSDNIVLDSGFGAVSTQGNIELGAGDDVVTIVGGGTNVTLGGMLFGGTGNDVIAFNVPAGKTLTYSFALDFLSTASSFENLVKQGTGTLALSSSSDNIVLDSGFGAVSTQGNIELGAGDDVVAIVGGSTNVTLGGTINGGTNTTPSGSSGGDTIVYDVPSGQTMNVSAISNFERLVKRGAGALSLNGYYTWESIDIQDGSVTF